MTTKKLLLLFAFLTFSFTASAQYYGNGVDRSIGQSARMNKPHKKNEKKLDFAESSVEYLNKQLNLDGLQQAAIKGILNDNKATLEEIGAENISIQEKTDKMGKATDKIDVDILKLLSKEQSEKYLKIKEDRMKKMLSR